MKTSPKQRLTHISKATQDSLSSLEKVETRNISWANQSPRYLNSARQSMFPTENDEKEDREMLRGIKLDHDLNTGSLPNLKAEVKAELANKTFSNHELSYRKKNLSRVEILKIRKTLVDKCEEIMAEGKWQYGTKEIFRDSIQNQVL